MSLSGLSDKVYYQMLLPLPIATDHFTLRSVKLLVPMTFLCARFVDCFPY